MALAAAATFATLSSALAFDGQQDWVAERFSSLSRSTNEGRAARLESAPGERATRRSTRATRTTENATASRRQRFAATTVEDDVQNERPQRRTTTTSRRDRAPQFAERSLTGGERGVASYYWQPQRVAAGGWFNPEAMTAAHKTLPFGSVVRVTRADTGQSVVVTINDRGPYIAGRIIDLSRRAAQDIGMTGRGIVPVSVSVIGHRNIPRNYN